MFINFCHVSDRSRNMDNKMTLSGTAMKTKCRPVGLLCVLDFCHSASITLQHLNEDFYLFV